MKKFFTVYLIVLFQISLFAQISKADILKEDLYSFGNTGISLIKSPLNFSKKDWIKTSIFTLTTISLFAFDKKVNEIALNNRSEINDHIFSFDKFHGKNYSLYFSLSLYGSGFLFNSEKVRKTGLNATEAFFYSGAIITLLKGIIGRERPYKQNNNLSFKPFQFNNDHFFSLPSGHATISFAVSTVMAKSVDNRFWKTFWYGSAVMVCASRIYHNRHWISDVFLGGAIGYSVADFVVNDKPKNRYPKLSIGYNRILIKYNF